MCARDREDEGEEIDGVLEQDEFLKRIAQVALETDSSNNSLWWLSFADGTLPTGTQFLGACIVEASNLPEAVTVSHLLGINPGGEIKIVGPMEPQMKPSNYPIGKLLNRSEIEKLDNESSARTS